MANDKEKVASAAVPDVSRNTSIGQALFNLTKSAVGFGTVLLPLNVKRCGLIPGVTLILFASLLSMVSLHFLAKSSLHTNTGDYFRLGLLSYGKVGEMVAIIALVVYLLGGIIAYVYFSGTYIANGITFFADVPFSEDTFRIIVTLIVTIFFLFPLSCLKDMSKLGKTSIMGLICISYIVCLTVYDYFADKAPKGEVREFPESLNLEFFTAFCSILFAYSNQFTLVSLTKVMEKPTTGRIRVLIGGSGIVSTIVYLVMGLFGYFHFGKELKSEVLSAKKPMTLPYAIGKLALGLVLIFSAPLLVDPARASLERLFASKDGKQPPASRHYIVTAGFVGTCLVVAVGAGKAGLTVLDVLCSLAGPILSFVFPAIYFVKLSRGNYKMNAFEWIMVIVLVVVGLIACVLGTYNSSNELITYLKDRIAGKA